MSDVKYIITADAKGAVKEIQKVDTSIDGMKTQAKKSISPLKGMFGQLAAGLVGTVAIGTAVHKLAGFLKDATEKAKTQETAEKGLMDALQSTGREVPKNAGHFKDYAKELQDATKYGDEQILSAQALLIQLTNLDRDGLDAATKGSLGLATVFKTDLKSATNLVAKALAGNYGALSRYGISVTDLNTDEEKRASLLDQLAVLYERSKGEVDTYEGAVTQLKNTYGDFQEKIGDVIVESDELRGVIQSIQDLMNNFVESGTMDNWASKFDLIIRNTPMLQTLKQSIFLLNAEMEIQIAKQKDANALYEGTKVVLEVLNTYLEALGVNLKSLIPGYKDVGDEGKTTNTKIGKLPATLGLTKTKAEELKLAWANLLDVLDLEVWGQTVDVIDDVFDEVELVKMELDTTAASGEILEGVFQSIGSTAKTDFGDPVKTQLKEVNEFAEGYATGVSDAFGDAFESILTKGSDLGDAMDILFDSLVGNIRKLLGDLLRDFLKDNIFKAMQSEATKAASSVTNTLSGLATGGATGGAGGTGGLLGAGGGAASGLWTGIGAFAGTALAGLLTGGGVSKRTGQDQLHEARLTNILLYQTQQHELHWINDNLNLMYTQFTELLLKSDAMIRIQRDIRKNLGGIPSGQGGLDFYSGSRGGLVRYHANEKVTIDPHFTVKPQGITIILDREAAKELSRSGSLTYQSKYGHVKIHERAIKRF